MTQFRLAFLSLLLAIFAFGLMPASASAQEENPDDQKPPTAKAPERSARPFLFPVAFAAMMLGLLVAATTGLAFAYKSKTWSGPTTCLAAGAFLLLFPLIGSILGSVVSIGITAQAFSKLGENEGAPQAGALESEMSASVILALLVSATSLAFPLGVIAIIAAFFFKKPAS